MPIKLGEIISGTWCNTKKGDEDGFRVEKSNSDRYYVTQTFKNLPNSTIEVGDEVLEVNGEYSDGYSSEEEMIKSIQDARHIRIKTKKLCKKLIFELHNLDRMSEYNGYRVRVVKEDKRSRGKRFWVRLINHPEQDKIGFKSIHKKNLRSISSKVKRKQKHQDDTTHKQKHQDDTTHTTHSSTTTNDSSSFFGGGGGGGGRRGRRYSEPCNSSLSLFNIRIRNKKPKKYVSTSASNETRQNRLRRNSTTEVSSSPVSLESGSNHERTGLGRTSNNHERNDPGRRSNHERNRGGRRGRSSYHERNDGLGWSSNHEKESLGRNCSHFDERRKSLKAKRRISFNEIRQHQQQQQQQQTRRRSVDSLSSGVSFASVISNIRNYSDDPNESSEEFEGSGFFD